LRGYHLNRCFGAKLAVEEIWLVTFMDYDVGYFDHETCRLDPSTICGKLLEAGIDPAERLEIYRGSTLALRVRSIGEGARLEPASNGVGFRWACEAGQAPDSAFPAPPGSHLARKPEKASLSLLPACPTRWVQSLRET
jgi:hypothetical protein